MKERKGTFWKILLTLLILGGLGYGGWYAYGRFFAEAPQEGTVFVQSLTARVSIKSPNSSIPDSDWNFEAGKSLPASDSFRLSMCVCEWGALSSRPSAK